MSKTVFVISNFTLAAGQKAIFSDPLDTTATGDVTAYQLNPLFSGMTITFTDAGDISVSDNQRNAITGIMDSQSLYPGGKPAGFIDGWKVTIASTGSLTVDATSGGLSWPGGETATGYSSALGVIPFENDGTVTVSSATGAAYGVAMVTGYYAGSIAAPLYPTVINTGTIQVSGSSGAGVEAGFNVSLTNSGSIIAQGGAYGVGVGLIDPAASGVVTIDNNGHIAATNGSTVGVGVASTYGGEVDLTNRGTIVGDVQLIGAGNGLYDGRGGALSGTLTLGGGHDMVYLGDDGETVQGGSGSATILGGADIDHITGGAGNDTIDGGGSGGGQTPTGFAGGDVLDGGGGVNTVSFASSPMAVAVTLMEQNGFQDVNVNHWVSLSNFQNLIGSIHNDLLSGDNNNNVIDGGGGNDALSGRGGADIFVFRVGYGADEITDFSRAQGDRISVAAFDSLHNLANVMALTTQSGSNAVISLPSGGSITLDSVSAASLTAADFIFPTIPGDFLGGGHASLFWQNSVNNLTSAWLLTDAAPASGVSLPAVSGWQTDDVGNFEGGRYGGDFLLRNTSSGMVDIWQDNAGTMSGHDVAKATLDWQIMGTADFNGDGKSDILWRNEQNGYVSVWQMDGSTVTTTYNPGVVGLEWKLVGADDFVGDGKAEVLWRNSSTGEVNLWTIDGPAAGQTHGQTVAFLGNGWNVGGTGDFNGDGKADILWFDTVTGQVVVWEMNGPTVLAAQPIGDPGPQWRVVDVADITGDGKADILWRDTGTGQVVAWAMNGFTVDHYGALGTVDNSWKVIDHHYDWA